MARRTPLNLDILILIYKQYLQVISNYRLLCMGNVWVKNSVVW